MEKIIDFFNKKKLMYINTSNIVYLYPKKKSLIFEFILGNLVHKNISKNVMDIKLFNISKLDAS